MKIVLVEDDPDIALGIQETIEDVGVTRKNIIHVFDLVSFQEALRAHQFVLAILDGKFPRTKWGLVQFRANEAYDSFRASSSGLLKNGNKSPVVLHTWEDRDKALWIMGSRSVNFLQKWSPNGLEELQAIITTNLALG